MDDLDGAFKAINPLGSKQIVEFLTSSVLIPNSGDVKGMDQEIDWSEGAASTSESAEWLGVSRRTLWRWMDSGELPFRMVGHRRRIPIASLRQILPEPAIRTNASNEQSSRTLGSQRTAEESPR